MSFFAQGLDGRLPAAEQQRWIVAGTGATAAVYTVVALVSFVDPNATTQSIYRLLGAAACWIAFVIARRGTPAAAISLAVAAIWVEVNVGFFRMTTFSATAMIVMPPLVAVVVLHFGPRMALWFALATIASAVLLVRVSPALAATGFTSEALFALTVYGAGIIALWVVMAMNVLAYERVFERTLAHEQAQLELASQLAHAQRLEAVGQLAGGIAHDFNNLLTAVGGSAELLRAELASAPQSPLVEDIIAAKERGAALTRQLLAFARRDVVQPRRFNLSAQIMELRRLLERVAGDRVTLVHELAAACPVLADIGQIEMALVNLVTNARDALPEGGTCVIRTSVVRHAADQRWVQLSVTDDGVGMDEATAARAFEPFFTTKDRGRGTGLGLASVHGIALQSGGRAMVQSVVGHGTVVTIELPFVEGAESVPVAVVPAASAPGGGTILIAEDDEATRRVTERILRRAGYEVLLAPDGLQALQLLEAEGGRVSLLLTDVMMPGLTGPQLAAKAQQHFPALPILFMSGYTADELTDMPLERHDRHFIPKPFTIAELLHRVADRLAATTRHASSHEVV